MEVLSVPSISASCGSPTYALAFASPLSVPRPSDVWSIVHETPGVILDRPDVGGWESVLPPLVVRRGDPGSGTTYSLDGLDVTDPAVPGASALYLHPMLLGNVRVSDGLHPRAPGVAVGMTSGRWRRGALVFARVAPEALEASHTRSFAEGGARIDGRLAGDRIAWAAGAAWRQPERLTSLLGRIEHGATSRTSSSLTLVRAENVLDERDTTLSTEPDGPGGQSRPVYATVARLRHVLSPSSVAFVEGGFIEADAGPLSQRRRLQAGATWTFVKGRSTFNAGAWYRRMPVSSNGVRSLQDDWDGYAVVAHVRREVSLTGGLRIDRRSGRNEASLDLPASPARFRWLDVLPRVEVRLTPPAHRWVAAARYVAYAGPLGSEHVTFDNPARDATSLSAVSLHRIDPYLRAPRTREWSVSLDSSPRALIHSSVSAFYRRNDRAIWRPLQGLTVSDYALRGAVVGTLLGEDYSVGDYAPASVSMIAPDNGRLLTNREGYHQDVLGLELVLSGRRQDTRWRAWASATNWRERIGDPSRAVQDPTSTDTEPLRDGGAVAARVDTLGRDLFVNARWTAGALVSAPLPAQVSGALLVRAREGFPVPYFQEVDAGDRASGSKNVLVASSLDRYRLPPLVQVDVLLSRAWRRRERQLTASVDVFNVLNSATPLQVNRDVEQPRLGEAREILRPRTVRLGLTLEL